MPTLNPYITLDGNCKEAFDYYRTIFGGELSDVSPYSEAPPGTPVDEADGDKLMHVSLPLTGGAVLMGSDRPSTMGAGTFGDTISITVGPDSAEEGRRIFAALAQGGQVTMPYERQFWGADYGMCIDRFGIHWMVNYPAPE
jgi:PhnB protein